MSVEEPPTPAADVDPETLHAIWREEVAASPQRLRGRLPGLTMHWPLELLAMGREDAETAVRAVAQLCRGTETRHPRVLDWSHLWGPKGDPSLAQDALAWAHGEGGEPKVGRTWRESAGSAGRGERPPPRDSAAAWASARGAREAPPAPAPAARALPDDAPASRLWRGTLDEISRHLAPAKVRTWFASESGPSVQPVALRGARLVVQAPTAYAGSWLREEYQSLMDSAVMVASAGAVTTVEVIADG